MKIIKGSGSSLQYSNSFTIQLKTSRKCLSYVAPKLDQISF